MNISRKLVRRAVIETLIYAVQTDTTKTKVVQESEIKILTELFGLDRVSDSIDKVNNNFKRDVMADRVNGVVDDVLAKKKQELSTFVNGAGEKVLNAFLVAGAAVTAVSAIMMVSKYFFLKAKYAEFEKCKKLYFTKLFSKREKEKYKLCMLEAEKAAAEASKKAIQTNISRCKRSLDPAKCIANSKKALYNNQLNLSVINKNIAEY